MSDEKHPESERSPEPGFYWVRLPGDREWGAAEFRAPAGRLVRYDRRIPSP